MSKVVKSHSEIIAPTRGSSWRPMLTAWFLIAAAIVVFSPLLEGGTTHVAVMTIRLMILGLAGMVLYRVHEEGEITFTLHRLALPVLAFLILASCSAVLSPYRHHSLQWLLVLLSYAMFLYLVVFFVTRWEHVAILLGIVVSMGCAETLLTLIETRQGNGRPTGTFFNPNFLAGYMVAAWTLTLSYLCLQPIRETKNQLLGEAKYALLTRLVLPACVAVALAVAICLTGSR